MKINRYFWGAIHLIIKQTSRTDWINCTKKMPLYFHCQHRKLVLMDFKRTSSYADYLQCRSIKLSIISMFCLRKILADNFLSNSGYDCKCSWCSNMCVCVCAHAQGFWRKNESRGFIAAPEEDWH